MLNSFNKFLNSDKDHPLLYAFAAGLYPMLYAYSSNFYMLNSWYQFFSFITYFLVLPLVTTLLLVFAVRQIKAFNFFRKYVSTGSNLFFFISLILAITYGYNKKIFVLISLGAFVLMFFLYKHIKKIVLLQLLMAILVFATLVPTLLKSLRNSDDWLKQPDTIEQVIFKKKPNIYVIQPDGYTNFSQLNKGYYAYDNSSFKSYLKNNSFKIYEDFRSNYYSTLTSNASMFAMKHHYYANPNEVKYGYDYRKVLGGDNSSISVLKKNGYKTFLLLQNYYILKNRPDFKYDYCNFSYEKMDFLAHNYGYSDTLLETLKNQIETNVDTDNFFFIERIFPTHIENEKRDSQGSLKERDLYIERLQEANQWLKDMIEAITNLDNNALIVIVADHGGYVGYDYAKEIFKKMTDEDLINSVFSSLLAIRWPKDVSSQFDKELHSSVNLFRVLFSCLSENNKYLDYLENDTSFLIIEKGSPFGVYEVIDEDGNVTFNRVEN